MASTILDRQDFDKKIEEAGEKLVIIDFYATWCGPCKMISPKLEELAQKYSEQAAVFKVDVDTCEDLANEYNITLMPTFVFMKNKSVVDVFVGGNAEKLAENLERFVSLEQIAVDPAVPQEEPFKKVTDSPKDDDASPLEDIVAGLKEVTVSEEELQVKTTISMENAEEEDVKKSKSASKLTSNPEMKATKVEAKAAKSEARASKSEAKASKSEGRASRSEAKPNKPDLKLSNTDLKATNPDK